MTKNKFHQLVKKSNNFGQTQRAKKVVSDSPGLVDFTIVLLYSVFCSFKLAWWACKWSFFRNSTYRRTVKSIVLIKTFFGLVEMMFGLVNVSFSLPEWQAVKMTFFASHPETTSLWIQPTFCNVTTGFPAKWYLTNKGRNSTLMTDSISWRKQW